MTAPARAMGQQPEEDVKRPFDIDIVLARIREVVKSFPKAAMFQLADEGYTTLFEQLIACIVSIRTRDEVAARSAWRHNYGIACPVLVKIRIVGAAATEEKLGYDAPVLSILITQQQFGEMQDSFRRTREKIAGLPKKVRSSPMAVRRVSSLSAKNLVRQINFLSPRVHSFLPR